MPPDGEARLLGLGRFLPEAADEAELAGLLGTSADELARTTGIARRHHAPAGEGPSDLALRAARDALAAASTDVADLGLIVFATATPDVTFPGAACYLQDKLAAPTVGAVDVRAQSAGFLCGLDLALAFAGLPAPGGGRDGRYARVLIAAGEVLSHGLDCSPRGRELSGRLADGAGAAVVGVAAQGPRIRAVRWYTDGTLAERFWCEYPASKQFPVRFTEENLRAGLQYPSADLAALAPIVPPRIAAATAEVLEVAGWRAGELDLAIVDYAVPALADEAARTIGIAPDKVVVPTARFGHVMAGGLVVALADALSALRAGARVLLAAAGPGLAWGAAAVEI
jgi:3-oxoacyl-[acyl-carrier-protein] synthase-3